MNKLHKIAKKYSAKKFFCKIVRCCLSNEETKH